MLYEIHPGTTCSAFLYSIMAGYVKKLQGIFSGSVNCIGLKKRNEIAFVQAIDQKVISFSDQ